MAPLGARARIRVGLGLMLASLTGVGVGCFLGEATLGAICFNDDQCGVGQGCFDSVCGMCRDGAVQAGELCFGSSSEENVFGKVSDLMALDIPDEGIRALVGVVNAPCENVSGDCWNLWLLLPEPDGGFEAFKVNEVDQSGSVPEFNVGNLDGDEVRDVVAAILPEDPLLDNSQLAILYDFPEQQDSINIDVALRPYSIEVADLDGNGFDDVLLGAEQASLMVLLPSTGSGFGTEKVLVTSPAPRLAPPTDMDNDGDLDLVVASEVESSLGVDFNDGAGNFSPQPRYVIGEEQKINFLTTADFDSDGNADVLVLTEPAQGFEDSAISVVLVYPGNGDGTLGTPSVMIGPDRPVFALTEDINHDDLPDLVIADIDEDTLPVYINRDGSFPDVVKLDVAAGPRTLLRDDFDGDGVPDIVVGNANGVIAVVPSEN